MVLKKRRILHIWEINSQLTNKSVFSTLLNMKRQRLEKVKVSSNVLIKNPSISSSVLTNPLIKEYVNLTSNVTLDVSF